MFSHERGCRNIEHNARRSTARCGDRKSQATAAVGDAFKSQIANIELTEGFFHTLQQHSANPRPLSHPRTQRFPILCSQIGSPWGKIFRPCHTKVRDVYTEYYAVQPVVPLLHLQPYDKDNNNIGVCIPPSRL